MSATVNSSFNYYMQNINTIPLLNYQEEKKIALAARNGDEKAKEKLVISNLRFVVKIARRYANRGVSLSDLISEGNIGLIRATQTFNPDRGYHFISYAVHWIKQSIIKCIAEKSRPVRMPVSWNNHLIKISRYFNHLDYNTLSNEKMEELAKELRMKKSEMISLIQFVQNFLSLDDPVFSEVGEQSMQIKNALKNEKAISPEDELSRSYLKKRIRTMLHELNPLEQSIIKRRFGLGKHPKRQTLLAISKELKFTKERVRQLEKRALDTLRQKFSRDDLVLIQA